MIKVYVIDVWKFIILSGKIDVLPFYQVNYCPILFTLSDDSSNLPIEIVRRFVHRNISW